jgi:hypothetical protein
MPWRLEAGLLPMHVTASRLSFNSVPGPLSACVLCRLVYRLRMVETEYSLSSRELYVRRDDPLPVCQFPPEIIVYIIKHIQGRAIDDDDIPASEQRLPLGKAWRYVTLTCSYIRNVANNSPDLWRKLESARNKSEWIQSCADRAGSLPLSIYFWSTWHKEQNDDHLFILRFLPRAYTALLCPSYSQDFAATVQALNNEPLTHMRFLELSGSKFTWRIQPTIFSMQPTFLGGATDQLERLVLQVVALTAIYKFPKNGLPALRYLQINFLKFERGDDMSRVVQWLSGASCIEEVFITMDGDITVATADRLAYHVCTRCI